MNDSATRPQRSSVELPALRSRLAELFLRVAETLDESAELAEGHAQRWEKAGRHEFVDAEMESARKARAGAQQARAAASRFSTDAARTKSPAC